MKIYLLLPFVIFMLGAGSVSAQYTWWYHIETPDNWPHGERYEMPEVLNILDDRIELPMYYNAYVDMAIKTPNFPKKQGSDKESIEQFREKLATWVIDHPYDVRQLLIAREEAVKKYSDPTGDPRWEQYNNEPTNNQ